MCGWSFITQWQLLKGTLLVIEYCFMRKLKRLIENHILIYLGPYFDANHKNMVMAKQSHLGKAPQIITEVGQCSHFTQLTNDRARWLCTQHVTTFCYLRENSGRETVETKNMLQFNLLYIYNSTRWFFLLYLCRYLWEKTLINPKQGLSAIFAVCCRISNQLLSEFLYIFGYLTSVRALVDFRP